MWALSTSRRAFLDFFGERRPPHLLEGVQPYVGGNMAKGELLLLWADQPRIDQPLPDAIAVQQEEMRSFIAWVTTVIGGYRPFTAFFRVLNASRLDEMLQPPPKLNSVGSALAGLVIGEALTLSAMPRSLASLAVLPCQSSYSYSYARALMLGHVRAELGEDPISAPMALARRLTRQPSRRLSDEALSVALGTVAALALYDGFARAKGSPSFVFEACAELRASGEVRRSWPLLGGAFSPSEAFLTQVRGPREQRLRAFEEAVRQAHQLDALSASFIVGLLADQIAPGTLEHVDLLGTYLQQYPMAMVWYGLCAGLRPDSEVQEAGNCLGRRLMRDLSVSDSPVSSPKFDISLSELEVYLDREVSMEFRVASNNHIAVELIPGVPAYMKWPVRESTETGFAKDSQMNVQPSLPLMERFREANLDRSRREQDGAAAIGELERAVDRVRSLLLPRTGDHTADRKRRKGR